MEEVRRTIDDVKEGDILADMSYVRVLAVNPPHFYTSGQALLVHDVNTQHQFFIRGVDLINQYQSGDRFTASQRVPLTEMATRLVNSTPWPFTVTFTKADKSTRVLRGRVISTEHLLGRSLCEDFDITEGDRLRLVDHRTLKRLVVQGIEYRLK